MPRPLSVEIDRAVRRLTASGFAASVPSHSVQTIKDRIYNQGGLVIASTNGTREPTSCLAIVGTETHGVFDKSTLGWDELQPRERAAIEAIQKAWRVRHPNTRDRLADESIDLEPARLAS